MSSTPLSHHSLSSASSAEQVVAKPRIKLTFKPLKLESTSSAPPVNGPENDATASAPGPSQTKRPITLRIKPSRSNSVADPSTASSLNEGRKVLPKLVLKPRKRSISASVAPTEDKNAMEVDVSTPQPEAVLSPPASSMDEEATQDEPQVEILSPVPAPVSSRSSRPPPPKPKNPRPIKLKPLKEVLKRLISQIKKKDDYAFFLNPVDTSQVPGYSDIIKQPMDFGTMTEKIEKGQYRSLDQFKDDFLLVTTNAKTFNPPPSLYYSEASKIEYWGLDQITKATAHVIEYEIDWNVDIVSDEAPTRAGTETIADHSGGEPGVPIGDVSMNARSPSVMSSAVGMPSLPTERSRRPLKGKKAPVVTESWEEGGHLPGFKEGLGVFPVDSDLAALMLELKLRGKRFTKKERLKREKEGPPYTADGSLDYSGTENPFVILHQLVPESLSTPELVPLIPIRTAPDVQTMINQNASQSPDEKRSVKVDGPVALPPECLPEILSDPARHSFVDPPSSTSVVGKTRLRHWTITRNPPRAMRAREDEEDSAVGLQTKRRRVEHTDYGAFATLLGTVAAENGLKVDDFEEMFGSDEDILDQIKQSIENCGASEKSVAKPELEARYRLLDADEYIRDIVYGGVDGLAYFRSLAEFVGEYYGPLNQDDVCTSGELGMPLAQWVTTHIVNPLTLGNHATLRAVTDTLSRANVQGEQNKNANASHAIARYLALTKEDKSRITKQLRELEALAEPSAQIDIAPLLRKPEELFLAEHEWAGRQFEVGEANVSAAASSGPSLPMTPIQAATISDVGAGTGAMLGLGLTSALPGQSRVPGTTTGDTAGAIEHALNIAAESLRDLGRRILEDDENRNGALESKIDGQTESEQEDQIVRRTRLTLIALAKRAPIDRIARLPAELVPVHIRHIVPTLGS